MCACGHPWDAHGDRAVVLCDAEVSTLLMVGSYPIQFRSDWGNPRRVYGQSVCGCTGFRAQP